MFVQQSDSSDSEDISTFVDVYREDSIFDLYLSSGSETLDDSKEKLVSENKKVNKSYKSAYRSGLKNFRIYSQGLKAYYCSKGESIGKNRPYTEKVEGTCCVHKEEYESDNQKISDKRKRKNEEIKDRLSPFRQEFRQQTHGVCEDGKGKRNEPLRNTTFEKMKIYFHISHWKEKKEGTEAPKLELQGSEVPNFIFRDDSSSCYDDVPTSDDGAKPLDKGILHEEHKRVVQNYRRLVIKPNSHIETYGYI